MIDEPLQYFFTSKWSQKESMRDVVVSTIETANEATIKYQLVPLKKNEILIRFENIADLFDYDKSAVLNDTTVFIDV